MINVICFLWGDWPEPGMGPEYVARLARAVKRNLSAPHQFICFADDPSRVPPGVEARQLSPPSWSGCLPKLFAYSPEAGIHGRTLVLDLDNVVVGPLDGFTNYAGPLAVRAWFRGWPRQKVADGDMISFEAGSPMADRLWERISADPGAVEAETGGRERYYLRSVADPDLWQDVLGPEAVLSYKNHLRNARALPEGARIVSFHDGGKRVGTMRPHQLLDKVPWLSDHWK